jgi:hypothetical protein
VVPESKKMGLPGLNCRRSLLVVMRMLSPRDSIVLDKAEASSTAFWAAFK